MIISILKMTWATYLFKTPRLFKTLEYSVQTEKILAFSITHSMKIALLLKELKDEEFVGPIP